MAGAQAEASWPAADLWPNPMGTAGFEFIEYTAPDPAELGAAFERLGFKAVARHRSKAVTLYRQGAINFVVNAEPESRAQAFARAHGPSACAMAFHVRDAAAAHARALLLGARDVATPIGPMELKIPAIEGIGGSLIYLADRRLPVSIYDIDFVFEAGAPAANDAGLLEIDHLTHNVTRGNLRRWTGYYELLFNFRETRSFEIEGKHTSSRSRAITSPCGKIRIPINESFDEESQIAEYLKVYRGEGIQHIALSTNDIYATVDRLRAKGVQFMPPPPAAYYEGLEARIGRHGESVGELARRGILIDGAAETGFLLQIFTENMIGPIFFEIIQRKGDEGFGEGNVNALYESVERDQIRRGVLKA